MSQEKENLNDNSHQFENENNNNIDYDITSFTHDIHYKKLFLGDSKGRINSSNRKKEQKYIINKCGNSMSGINNKPIKKYSNNASSSNNCTMNHISTNSNINNNTS